MKQSIKKSFFHAFEGIYNTFKTERNMKIHVFIMMVVIICGFFFHITKTEWLICILLFAGVLSLEIINTAIEATIDLVSPDFHPLAKIAKDAAAGAVLIIALAAMIIGLMIFVPYIL